MPRLYIPYAALEYDLSGDGPMVVQLHGLTSSRASDAQLGLDLAGRITGYRVLRYDARGHGASTGDRDPSSYTWPHLADDLITLLDNLSPEQPVHAVGQSMGCGTLLHAATRQPGRFSSLTLVIPPTAWETRRAQAHTYRERADLIRREGARAFVREALAAARPPAVAPDTPVIYPTVEEEILPSVFRGAATSDLPTAEQLSHLDIPTLILAWVGDPSHPLETTQRLQELLPDSRVSIAHTPDDVRAWPSLLSDHLRLARERARTRSGPPASVAWASAYAS